MDHHVEGDTLAAAPEVAIDDEAAGGRADELGRSLQDVRATLARQRTDLASLAPQQERFPQRTFCAVAARSADEVWVVNHLSDSVSIVSVNGAASRVVRTLNVGDEPRDIVFAGADRSRAFITTAHRGQNAPYDPQLTTPGIGRADVWVFDAAGTTPLAILNLFTDTPRGLAVTPDGARVYAAGFLSGNQTTTIQGSAILPGMYPGPLTNHAGELAPPQTGLIVKVDGTHWVDENGTAHDHAVKFALPDKDVFVIDAVAPTPHVLAGSAGFRAHVAPCCSTSR